MPLHRRLPKRGFKSLMAGRVAEVRLSDLERIEATEVDLLTLKQAGVVSQLALAIPMILLYEMGIWAAQIFIRHTKAPQEEEKPAA